MKNINFIRKRIEIELSFYSSICDYCSFCTTEIGRLKHKTIHFQIDVDDSFPVRIFYASH